MAGGSLISTGPGTKVSPFFSVSRRSTNVAAQSVSEMTRRGKAKITFPRRRLVLQTIGYGLDCDSVRTFGVLDCIKIGTTTDTQLIL